jgi:ABC-2 type transport system permease protein
VVIDVKLDVDIDTQRHVAVAKGRYVLENQTRGPLSQLVINWPGTAPTKLSVQDAAREIDLLKEHVLEIWRFKTPMQPGERRVVTFEVTQDQSTFGDGGSPLDILENGTFLSLHQMVPDFALSDSYFHDDPTKRRKYGLPPKPRMPPRDDAFAKTRNFYAVDAGFVTSDISVTMPADQIVIVPGQQISQTTNNGRTTTRFVSEAPMSYEFSVLGARYAVHNEQISANGKPVTLSIYHLPGHNKNIARMARSARISLDLFAKEFGPYPFSTLKIVEVPGYGGDVAAVAMSGVIPFYEDTAWLQTNRAGDLLDNASSVTAHEIAHMWWGHQISPSSNAGAQVLSESLAEYSALYAMIFVRSYNDAIAQLKNSMETYRRDRGSDPIGENPLGQMEGQNYLAYQRGAATFWLLRDQMGQETLHNALAQFITQHRYAKAVYPGTPELVATLKGAAAPAQQKLIDMLFDKISFFDFEVFDPQISKTDDGKDWVIDANLSPSVRFVKPDGSEDGSASFSGRANVQVNAQRWDFPQNPDKNGNSAGVWKDGIIDNLALVPFTEDGNMTFVLPTTRPGGKPGLIRVDPDDIWLTDNFRSIGEMLLDVPTTTPPPSKAKQ